MIGSPPYTITLFISLSEIMSGSSERIQVTLVGGLSVTLKLIVNTGGSESLGDKSLNTGSPVPKLLAIHE